MCWVKLAYELAETDKLAEAYKQAEKLETYKLEASQRSL